MFVVWLWKMDMFILTHQLDNIINCERFHNNQTLGENYFFFFVAWAELEWQRFYKNQTFNEQSVTHGYKF